MGTFDFAVVLAYLAACLGIGAWFGRRGRGPRDYFLAERNLPGWAVCISIVATETSAVTFLSVPGLAYRGDLRFLQLAMGYVIARVLVAAFLMPLYFRGEIQTAYEVLQGRFGPGVRTAASVLFLGSRTVGSGLRLLLAAKVLAAITASDLPLAIVVIGSATMIYTYLGGLRAVVWADVLQFALYLAAAAVAVVLLHSLVPGGWGAVLAASAREGKLRVFDLSADPTVTYTLWAGLIGATALDAGTHGADHMMVQRYLSARSQTQASRALIASGLVIFAQFALFLFLGLGIAELDRVAPPLGGAPAKDGEFALFLVTRFPWGFKGLVVAAIFAVTMSTVSGALNASASSLVHDLIRPVRPGMTDRGLMRWSKGATFFWGAAQVAVALAAAGMDRAIVDQALAVASFVTGPLLGVFLLGMLTKGVSGRAALAGMVFGLASVSIVALLGWAAYPWWALVGSTGVLVGGVGAEALIRFFAAEKEAR